MSVHLVEISPVMREMQRASLCGKELDSTELEGKKDPVACGQSVTESGIPVSWYRNIFDAPKGLSFYLAHEFFDALPIHQFQNTEHGWREVMVDLDEEDGPHHLKFCLAPGPTPATVLIPQKAEGDQLEVRPQAQLIAETMAQNICDYGGCSLIVDYGDIKSNRFTLRAFHKHELRSPLAEPGQRDLTSNVDFLHLQNVFKGVGVDTFGPVSQKNFLMSMGIDVRRQTLLKKATPLQAQHIQTAFRMLTSFSEMGDCFKFFTAAHHGTTKPPGF